MKTGIHPTYYPNAQVQCACGNSFTVGSTKERIEVDICSNCHPFYTGNQKFLDTAGRIDRFRARVEKRQELGKKSAPSKTSHEPAPVQAGDSGHSEAPAGSPERS